MTNTPPNRRNEVESWWPIIRDIVSFLLGVGGFIWQLAVAPSPEPTLLAASIALLGLPAAAQLQRNARKPDDP